MATWYAAHTIVYAQFNDGIQDTYPTYENVILIEAESVEAARLEAERIARAETNASDVTVDGRPARLTFAGIRKLVECQDTTIAETERKNEPFRPLHGTELTYSYLVVASAEDFHKLVHGEPALVWYES
jgi:hypothetical protein